MLKSLLELINEKKHFKEASSEYKDAATSQKMAVTKVGLMFAGGGVIATGVTTANPVLIAVGIGMLGGSALPKSGSHPVPFDFGDFFIGKKARLDKFIKQFEIAVGKDYYTELSKRILETHKTEKEVKKEMTKEIKTYEKVLNEKMKLAKIIEKTDKKIERYDKKHGIKVPGFN